MTRRTGTGMTSEKATCTSMRSATRIAARGGGLSLRGTKMNKKKKAAMLDT